MITFFKQVRIYFRLLHNYQKIARKKSFYFYVYSMPIFGFPFFLVSKIILKIKSNYLTNFFLECENPLEIKWKNKQKNK